MNLSPGKGTMAASSIVVLAAIVVLFNALSGRVLSRFSFDLTESNIYSLSTGSKNILSELPDDITLRLYFSRTDSSPFPALRLYGDRVQEFLREYEQSSSGRIKLVVADPRPDSEEEEWAHRYGLRPVSLATGETLFFGLVGINAQGREEVIPFFNLTREELLEYDITKLVYSLANPKKPKVAVISSLDLTGKNFQMNPQTGQPIPGRPWFLMQQLGQLAETSLLETPIETIDADVSVLALVHPKQLDDTTLYAIDQFVMRGGKLFVAVDPYSHVDQPPPDPQNPMAGAFADRSSSLERLLTSWGVNLELGRVVGDLNLSTLASTGRGAPMNYVLWLSLTEEVINQEDVASAQLQNMVLPWAGSLRIEPREGASYENLLQSSADSMLYDVGEVQFGGGDPKELLKKFVSGSAAQTLAVRISGTLPSAFPEKASSGDSESASKLMSKMGQHLHRSASSVHVVVISDVDFMSDAFAVNQMNLFGNPVASYRNDNLVFVQNVIENLSGSDNLISVRSRGKFVRPFYRVQEIERAAEERWLAEETRLQEELQAANERIQQLQSASGAQSESGSVLNSALVEEVKRFQSERAETQRRLREVRKHLRQDKERLGVWLFYLNTFLVPVVLVVSSVWWFRRKARGVGRVWEGNK